MQDVIMFHTKRFRSHPQITLLCLLFLYFQHSVNSGAWGGELDRI